MKTNFSTGDYLELSNAVHKNTILDVRVNKAGNLTIDGYNEKFTLRVHNNGKYIWSRYNYLTGYSHPLNMRGRKCETRECMGNTYIVKDHNMNMYTFNTLDKAIDYIIDYFKRYRSIYYEK